MHADFSSMLRVPNERSLTDEIMVSALPLGVYALQQMVARAGA